MKDIEIILENKPGQLALMGETLGKAGVNVEGGGGFLVNANGVMHFLLDKPELGKEALQQVGIQVNQINEILIVKLKQEVPGQLGLIARRMADAGVNIEVVYSDHINQLILVVDDMTKGSEVVKEWNKN